MLSPDDYALLDFGEGRRLERFGPVIVDRPAPAVDRVARAQLDLWSQAAARYERTGPESGRWIIRGEVPPVWSVRRGALTFELKCTPLGQVGLFPEQAANWPWLRDVLDSPPSRGQTAQRLRVLNLFAYTGASTLAAALVGAEVVHVDAAKNVVAWARRNAELSGLADRPIRWIVEDALKFCKRELRRGARYDAVILDPPSYGHGPRGEVWRLSKHLERLLALSAGLAGGRPRFVLLTCHTPGYDAPRLGRMVEATFGGTPGRTEGETLVLRSADGREMPAGVAVRWRLASDG